MLPELSECAIADHLQSRFLLPKASPGKILYLIKTAAYNFYVGEFYCCGKRLSASYLEVIVRRRRSYLVELNVFDAAPNIWLLSCSV